ncbi:hypothetical protein AGMMS49545_20820 [Betaproteobacteria bacterium]|nr:hypothetical protein AGMMS49545_20820 [Betaproteobacteria bacterium]
MKQVRENPVPVKQVQVKLDRENPVQARLAPVERVQEKRVREKRVREKRVRENPVLVKPLPAQQTPTIQMPQPPRSIYRLRWTKMANPNRF